MEARFGHGRGRAVGANGHSAFEVFLKGDAYGAGQWVLLDHDLSNVVFDPSGRRLLGMKEITLNGNIRPTGVQARIAQCFIS